MKAFGYREKFELFGDTVVTCGVIFADSEDEAKSLMPEGNSDDIELSEIPMKKGYHFIG
ncbi:MAG: hypothetical protein K0R54_207 [Clostridiaceae bacterium]|jgi:hypothetical protein|nr:hypothetical protein [Clostridiaceae bacterium]